VQESRPDVGTFLGEAKGQKRGGKVDDKGEGREHHHDPARHLGRIEKPHHRLRPEPQGNDDQHGVVDERCHHLCPAKTEGHARVGGPPADSPRGKGDDRRRGIRKIVDRVGNERDRTEEDAAGDLRYGEKDIDHHGKAEAALPCMDVAMRMAMMPARPGATAMVAVIGHRPEVLGEFVRMGILA